MKKIFLAFTLLIFTTAIHAQMKTMFYHQGWEQIWKLKDSVELVLPKDYKFVSLDTLPNALYTPYKHVFFYFKNMNDEDVVIDLQRTLFSNKMTIDRVKIDGPFLALFPIWKRYFDNNADMSSVQGSEHGSLKKNRLNDDEFIMPLFNKASDGWYISHKYPMRYKDFE